MKKSERQRQIMQRLRAPDSPHLLATRELALAFAVSETTIRRDLEELAQAGLLQRRYGGAQPRQDSRKNSPRQVGILLASRIDKYRDPFYNMVLEGADRRLDELGYRVAFIKTLHAVASARQAQELLSAFAIDGLILLGEADTDSIAWLRRSFAPIVTSSDRRDIDDDLILFDGSRGMQQMVAHLARLGYRRLGYIAGYEDLRYDGFLRGLDKLGLPRLRCLRQICKPGPSGWTPDVGERGARALMSMQQPPEAIVCASDRLAIGAMAWLQSQGIRVPQDIAITGFDDIPDSRFAFPPLTTVAVQKLRLGELAAERIARRIKSRDETPLAIITPTRLVVRQSCGAASRSVPS